MSTQPDLSSHEPIDVSVLVANDLQQLEKCIQIGANPNKLGGVQDITLSGWNPLSYSLSMLSLQGPNTIIHKMIMMLLEAGANPNGTISSKLEMNDHTKATLMTPLLIQTIFHGRYILNGAPYTMQTQSLSIMYLLLCLGADPRPVTDALSGQDTHIKLPITIAMGSPSVRALFVQHADFQNSPRYHIKHLITLSDCFPQRWLQLKSKLRPIDIYTYLHSNVSLEQPQAKIDELRYLHKWSASDPRSFPDAFRNMVMELRVFGQSHPLFAAVGRGIVVFDLVCDHLPLTMCSGCLHDHQERGRKRKLQQ